MRTLEKLQLTFIIQNHGVVEMSIFGIIIIIILLFLLLLSLPRDVVITMIGFLESALLQ